MTQDCFYAVRTGNVPLTEKLLDAGQCTVTTTRWSGVTLLHRAAGEGQTECIQLLIRHGANPAAVTHRGLDTPLHLAMGAGHESAAEALLWGGSPWHKENGAKRTPMQHAVELGFALMARRLEVAYFRIDAKLRKRREQDALAAAAPVVVAGYEKPLVAAPGQAKAAAHRARFKTLFSQVHDSLAAKRFRKTVMRRRDDESDDGASQTSLSSMSVATAATNEPKPSPANPATTLTDKERKWIRQARKAESPEDKAARDAAIDAWTADPGDEAKRAEAVKAFALRMEGIPDDDELEPE